MSVHHGGVWFPASTNRGRKRVEGTGFVARRGDAPRRRTRPPDPACFVSAEAIHWRFCRRNSPRSFGNLKGNSNTFPSSGKRRTNSSWVFHPPSHFDFVSKNTHPCTSGFARSRYADRKLFLLRNSI